MLARSTIPEPAQLLGKLLPDAAVRQRCLDRLARSISLAHAHRPGCWSVTATENYVRLNVGKIEVLTLSRDRLHLVILRPKASTLYKSVLHSG